MKIIYIAAGAGPGYCGACHRDVTLVKGLQARGHDAFLVPLYTPIRSDEAIQGMDRMFYGGINAYLQQALPIFRKAPRILDWIFDRRWLLNLVSRFAIDTRPEDLGDMTVSVLKGTDGYQKKELDKLMDFLMGEDKPDVLNLTNSLLSGIAPEVKRRLKVPVACTLQGEESFIARLPLSCRQEAQALLRKNSHSIDLFISPSEQYAEMMTDYLAVARSRIEIVPPGVEMGTFTMPEARPEFPMRIGFLSRISPVKGLDLLVESFCRMEKARSTGAVLAVAGTASPGETETLSQMKARLSQDGLLDRLEYSGELDLPGKLRFLRSCHVFCQPSRFPEQRGMACLEAMATGLPAVVPRTGIFPEVINCTGGGLLIEPEHVPSIAASLTLLRDDPETRHRMGQAAHQGVSRFYSSDLMVSEALEAYERLL